VANANGEKFALGKMMKVSNASDPIEEFFADFEAGNIVFFAGSGISCNSGLPSAQNILLRSARCVLPDLIDGDIKEIIGPLQPELFYEILLSITGSPTDSPAEALLLWSCLSLPTQQGYGCCTKPSITHLSIVKNAAKHGNPIYTTNFDELFETACRKLGAKPQVLIPTLGDGAGTDGDVRIIKAHGTIGSPNSMFLTMTNITRLNPRFIEMLSKDTNDKKLCIVGYSGRDLDIFPTIRALGFRDFKKK
jgi:hypothetical protein